MFDLHVLTPRNRSDVASEQYIRIITIDFIDQKGPINKLFKVNLLTEAISPKMVHDKCNETMFGPRFICELNDYETESKMECIEDCGRTMYICDCNVYRYS